MHIGSIVSDRWLVPRLSLADNIGLMSQSANSHTIWQTAINSRRYGPHTGTCWRIRCLCHFQRSDAIARMGTLRFRHIRDAASVALSLDGIIPVITGSHNTSIILWDAATGKELRRLSDELPNPIGSPVFSQPPWRERSRSKQPGSRPAREKLFEDCAIQFAGVAQIDYACPGWTSFFRTFGSVR
jgi:hypothetical protein